MSESTCMTGKYDEDDAAPTRFKGSTGLVIIASGLI